MARTLVTREPRFPSLFDDVRSEFGELFNRVAGWDGGQNTGWFAPSANLAETDKAYEVSLDLPGLKPEDVQIELKEGQLWISGQRKSEQEEKGKTWHRVERSYGQFRRVVMLGHDVDGDRVEANYRDGVLVVTVPKVVAAQAKRIEIKS